MATAPLYNHHINRTDFLKPKKLMSLIFSSRRTSYTIIMRNETRKDESWETKFNHVFQYIIFIIFKNPMPCSNCNLQLNLRTHCTWKSNHSILLFLTVLTWFCRWCCTSYSSILNELGLNTYLDFHNQIGEKSVSFFFKLG